MLVVVQAIFCIFIRFARYQCMDLMWIRLYIDSLWVIIRYYLHITLNTANSGFCIYLYDLVSGGWGSGKRRRSIRLWESVYFGKIDRILSAQNCGTFFSKLLRRFQVHCLHISRNVKKYENRYIASEFPVNWWYIDQCTRNMRVGTFRPYAMCAVLGFPVCFAPSSYEHPDIILLCKSMNCMYLSFS